MATNLMAIAAQRISYLADSQNVLARNIANIDTPGFTPQSMTPFQNYLDRTAQITPTVTHADDLPGQSDPASGTTPAAMSERAPDGNAVSLTQELAAVAKTQIDQQYSVNIYKSYIGMFTTALGPNI
ncbi:MULTISPECIES: flagellar basal body rod protein FlgB [Acidiphilium]|jgi:flagellar basal-body rod protein FlgB|uniref:Flagellar basal-body rod protein FlgB n=1 Tax=Acidiphilium rubrum TaxID=526 RepID=A0A8G2CLD9_ACIRU|nr:MULTISPECIES: flagellar basal body protein [Acidiphilium]MBW4035798.1 flagellar basal body protein [Pseudomonadota bacterium]SIQ99724.1 flagellar basal-body rod protein FlgB [Acidiphilium rubrum]